MKQSEQELRNHSSGYSADSQLSGDDGTEVNRNGDTVYVVGLGGNPARHQPQKTTP